MQETSLKPKPGFGIKARIVFAETKTGNTNKFTILLGNVKTNLFLHYKEIKSSYYVF